MLNVFNLLQWCFNRLIPAQPSHFGMFVNPRMATLTRGSFHSNNILFENERPTEMLWRIQTILQTSKSTGLLGRLSLADLR